MAIVRTPSGKRYDTVRRVVLDETLGEPAAPTVTPLQTIRDFNRRSRDASRRYGRRNLWTRLNDSVSDLGSWIGRNEETFSTNLSVVFYVLAWAAVVIGVITTWINHGFWIAVIAGIIGSIIVYFAALIGAIIFMLGIRAVFLILRGILYNAYTLIITVLIAGALVFAGQMNKVGDLFPTSIQQAAPETTTYICTARTVLNVRFTANTESRVIGTLAPGQRVEVYTTINGFAKIKYGEGVGYASLQYLRKAD